MARSSHYRFLVLLALILLVQKGYEVFSRLQPQGTRILLVDGTRLLVGAYPPPQLPGADLRDGDTLLFLDGRRISGWPSLNAMLNSVRSQFNVMIQVNRQGRIVTLAIHPRGTAFHLASDQITIDESFFYTYSFLYAFLTFGAGVLVFATRPESKPAFLFLAMSASIVLARSEIPYEAPEAVILISALAIQFARTLFPALFLHFFLTYPRLVRLPKLQNWLFMIYLWGVPVLVLRIEDSWRWWNGAPPRFSGLLEPALGYFYTVLCFVMAGLAIGFSLYRGTDDEGRKLRWMIFGVSAGLLPEVLLQSAFPALFPGTGERLSSIVTWISPLTLLFPWSFAYPLLKYRIVGIRTAFNSLLQAAASGRTLSLLLILPTSILVRSLVLSLVQGGRVSLGSLAAIVILLAAILRIRRVSTDIPGSLLFPGVSRVRRELRLLREQMLWVDDLEGILKHLGDGIRKSLNIEAAHVFLWDEGSQSYKLRHSALRSGENPPPQVDPMSRDSSILALLKKSNGTLDLCFELPGDLGNLLPSSEKASFLRMNIALIVPLRFGDQWVGWLALGEKANREAFSREEKKLLMQLGSTSARAITRTTNRR